jgi:uroporphyrinogen-III synthase
LHGRTVVVTRAAEQAGRLVTRLTALGASVIEAPTVGIADPPDGGAALAAAVENLDRYDWVVLTSTNGVDRFVRAVGGRPLRGQVAAVGPGTAAALAAAGLAPALLPTRFVAEGLLDVFPRGDGRVLLPQAQAARPVLADGLRSAGWQVDVVVAYRSVPVAPPPGVVARARQADAITFTSGSTVAGYVAAGSDAIPPIVVCIGPVTADAATAAGLRVSAVAAEHTIDGLVATVVEVLSS